MSCLQLRRATHLQRQPRVDDCATRRQCSEPAPPPTAAGPSSAPNIRRHHSCPQFAARMRRPIQRISSLLIRAVIDGQPSTVSTPAGSLDGAPAPPVTARASHTPAVRSGPPLSCNFCWNTVDECGRILRRKTQYHCPECRTNLCIVPCFHEYHEAETELASVR